MIKSIFLLIMNFILVFTIVGCTDRALVYTISFESNGGNILAPIEVEEGASITLPPNPTKEGYLFEGWYFDESFSQSFLEGEPSEKDDQNIILYAKWTQEDSELTILLKNIYQLAIDSDAFTGTYEAWLETVRGPQGLPGEDGIDGKTPYIGENGHWFIDQIDTGVFAGYYDPTIPLSGAFEFAVNSDGESYYLLNYSGFDRFVSIPEYFNGYPVTSIGPAVFSNNTIIEHVYIPNQIEEIEDFAFFNATALTTITFQEDSQLIQIGDEAFSGATSLTSITIPKGVISIGDSAFYGATSLITCSIEEESKLTTIGSSAFRGASALTSIVLPEGVTKIGDSAFFDAISLKSINIPSGVTSIEDKTFYRANALSTVTFEENSQLTSIKESAFYFTTSLTNFDIPKNLTSIEYGAFYAASALKTLHIPASVTTIEAYAFTFTSSLESITFEEGSQLTSIENSLFFGSVSLTSIEIPASVTSIGTYAFYSTSALASITFEEGSMLTRIKDYAFYQSNAVTTIYIPDGVTTIESYAFSQMYDLMSIYIPISVTSIGDYAFYSSYVLNIYAEIASKPLGWHLNWNPSNRPVTWGYIG